MKKKNGKKTKKNLKIKWERKRKLPTNKNQKRKMSRVLHTNFPVENDDNMMLESSLPLIIIVLSIAEVTQITAAICSLKRNLLHVIVANKNYDDRELRQCTVPSTHTHTRMTWIHFLIHTITGKIIKVCSIWSVESERGKKNKGSHQMNVRQIK